VDAALSGRIARLLGSAVEAARPALRGYTPALRYIASLRDGRSVFVKAGADELTSGWLRDEHAVYAALRAPFQPALLGWDPEDPPILVLEDLSDAAWPPPWTDPQIEAVVDTLHDVHVTQPPTGLPAAREFFLREPGWTMIAADPAPFLSLGMSSAAWLEGALPELIRAEASAPLEGDALLHFDVRSDNLCVRGSRAILIDWNGASVGNPDVDLASWLPSLEVEGGPPPEAHLPDAPALAALVAGYFAARAGLPTIPRAPRVRDVQRQQLASALPWACRALALPPARSGAA
jgi:hypothetical protein